MAGEIVRRVVLLCASALCLAALAARAFLWRADFEATDPDSAHGSVKSVGQAALRAACSAFPVLVLAFVGLLADGLSGTAEGAVFSHRIGVGAALCAFGDVAADLLAAPFAPRAFRAAGVLMAASAFRCEGSLSSGNRSREASRRWTRRFAGLLWASIVSGAYGFVAHHMASKDVPQIDQYLFGAYTAVLAVGVYRAWGRRMPQFGQESYVYGATGMALVAASEALAVYDGFVENLNAAEVASKMMYYMGHVALATATILPSKSEQLKMVARNGVPAAEKMKPQQPHVKAGVKKAKQTQTARRRK
mmetsp:Transcript_7340/g.14607  ORF Transcript_7340/g.14607 Transcript_7340/m.14607 type:complete len:305 (-) Transcript_7340:204-1118(-)